MPKKTKETESIEKQRSDKGKTKKTRPWVVSMKVTHVK